MVASVYRLALAGVYVAAWPRIVHILSLGSLTDIGNQCVAICG